MPSYFEFPPYFFRAKRELSLFEHSLLEPKTRNKNFLLDVSMMGQTSMLHLLDYHVEMMHRVHILVPREDDMKCLSLLFQRILNHIVERRDRPNFSEVLFILCIAIDIPLARCQNRNRILVYPFYASNLWIFKNDK